MSLARRLAAEGIGSVLLAATVVGSGIMAERLAGGNVAVALLANTGATVAVLATLIALLGPVSGAHFFSRGFVHRSASREALAGILGGLRSDPGGGMLPRRAARACHV